MYLIDSVFSHGVSVSDSLFRVESLVPLLSQFASQSVQFS
jgi:hypothetical protein